MVQGPVFLLMAAAVSISFMSFLSILMMIVCSSSILIMFCLQIDFWHLGKIEQAAYNGWDFSSFDAQRRRGKRSG